MSEPADDWISNPLKGREGHVPGQLRELEKWWVERQKALELAGYMLRPRYHPDWKPSWIGTKKDISDCEDGQCKWVSVYTSLSRNRPDSPQGRMEMDATRIADGKPVYLKRLPEEEGPYELQINRLFSSVPLASDPRNHCACLLDVIELPNDEQIMVHSQLRPFNRPPFNTYGEFVIFFEHICEVCVSQSLYPVICSIHQGVQFMHENNVAHR